MQQHVFRDGSEAWETIGLAHCRLYMYCRNLSDFQLSRLLIRVNAREVSKTLNISGCRNIYGFGLTSLRGSRVLEKTLMLNLPAQSVTAWGGGGGAPPFFPSYAA
jgi:hypothetical protein